MKTTIKLLTHFSFCFLVLFILYRKSEPNYEILICGIMLSLLATIYYIVREKVEQFWVFLSAHFIGIILSVLLISSDVVIQYMGWFCLGIVIYSILIRYVPFDLEAPRYLHLALFIMVYYLTPIYQNYCLAMTIIFFLMILLYNNMQSMDFYVATRSLTVAVDEKEVKKKTRLVSLIYIGILGMILGIIGLVHTNVVWQWIGKVLRLVIHFIARLFLPKEQDAVLDEQTEEDSGEISMFPLEEGAQPSHLAQILSEIFRYLILIGLLAVLVFLLIKVIVWFYHYFYESKIREDASVVVERISRLEHKIGQKERKKRMSDSKLTNRIRKLYRKMLKKKGAKQIHNIRFLTPKKQLNILCKDDYTQQNLTELQRLYEKARYGNGEITAEESAKFKTIYNERNKTS